MNTYEKTIQKINRDEVPKEIWSDNRESMMSNQEFLDSISSGSRLFPTIWYLRDCEHVNAKTLNQIAREGIVVSHVEPIVVMEGVWKLGRWEPKEFIAIVFEDVNNQRLPHVITRSSLKQKFLKIENE